MVIPKPKAGELWHFEGELGYRLKGLKSIEAQGFKIGIGVATGDDSVFIGKDLGKKVEKELLIPIVLSRDITDGQIEWSGNQLIYPYESDGSALIDLKEFPRARRYFETHQNRLKKRHVAKRKSSDSFRTIDRINKALIPKPKLLIPDMKKSRMVALDSGKYYPHHNVYYVANGSVDNLKAMGALFMSDLFQKQLERISVKMNGGLLRRQAQNLRRVKSPEVELLPARTKRELVRLFERRAIKEIDAIMPNLIGKS